MGPKARASVLELETLEYLDISLLTGINNSWLAQLGELPNLRVLIARRTCFGDPAAVGLASSASLQALDLRHTACGNAGLEALAAAPHLRSLMCHVGRKVPDAGLRALAKSESLERLAAARPLAVDAADDLSRATVAALSRNPRLTTLTLFGIIDSSSRVGELAALPNLVGLGLGGNYYGGTQKWMRQLPNFKTVRALDLSECYFSSAKDLEAIDSMPSLDELSLASVILVDQATPWSSLRIKRLVTWNKWPQRLFPAAKVVERLSNQSHLLGDGLQLPADLESLAPPPQKF